MMARIIGGLRRRYWRARMAPLLWRLANGRGRRLRHRAMPVLTPAEERIVGDLGGDGVAMTSLTELGLDALWEPMHAATRALKERWERDGAWREEILKSAESEGVGKGAKKLFLIPLYGGGWTLPILESENPFIRFSLAEPVLRIVGTYMGLAPRLDSFNLSETVVAPGGEATLSQRWHRDPEDIRVAKAFIYLTDVLNESAGPFTYVKGSQRGARYGRLAPQQFPAGAYPKDGLVERAVEPAAIRQCLGRAGTVIFADTAGLHKGGFSTSVPRLMYTAGFVSGVSTQPRKFTLPAALPADLTPLAEAALRV